MYRPYRPSVQLDDVRPKVIALLQAYGPTEAVAEVTGVPDATIRGIYSRTGIIVSWPAYDKIKAAYKKKSRDSRSRRRIMKYTTKIIPQKGAKNGFNNNDNDDGTITRRSDQH